MQAFKFELQNGITICSDLPEAEVAIVPGINKRDIENGYVWYTFPPIESNGESVVFKLCFFQSKIQSLNIFLSNPEKYGGSWNDWSEEKERACAKDTEKWLNTLGFNVGSYQWGEIWSGYDSKGASGSTGIRYAL